MTEKYLTLAGGILITLRPNKTDTTARTYSLTNIHGDTMATLDANGTLIAQTMTGPFGEQLPNQPDNWNTLPGTTYGYVGKAQKQTETKLAIRPMQMGARVYIPTIGRFIQVDPVQGGTPNNYVYPTDPVNDYDLTGTFSWKFWQKNKTQEKKYNKPSAVGGYAHYLVGAGKSQTMQSNKISWRINTDDTSRLNLGKNVNVKVGATAQGLNGAVHIGRTSGTFTGVVSKASTGYRAVGTYLPNKDYYDFNTRDVSRTPKNIALTYGGAGTGFIISVASQGIIQPRNYNIYFEGGAGPAEASW